MIKKHTISELKSLLKIIDEEIYDLLLKKTKVNDALFHQNFENTCQKTLKYINNYLNYLNPDQAFGSIIDNIILNLDRSLVDFRVRNPLDQSSRLAPVQLQQRGQTEEQEEDEIYHFMNTRNTSIPFQLLAHLGNTELERQRNQLVEFVTNLNSRRHHSIPSNARSCKPKQQNVQQSIKKLCKQEGNTKNKDYEESKSKSMISISENTKQLVDIEVQTQMESAQSDLLNQNQKQNDLFNPTQKSITFQLNQNKRQKSNNNKKTTIKHQNEKSHKKSSKLLKKSKFIMNQSQNKISQKNINKIQNIKQISKNQIDQIKKDIQDEKSQDKFCLNEFQAQSPLKIYSCLFNINILQKINENIKSSEGYIASEKSKYPQVRNQSLPQVDNLIRFKISEEGSLKVSEIKQHQVLESMQAIQIIKRQQQQEFKHTKQRYLQNAKDVNQRHNQQDQRKCKDLEAKLSNHQPFELTNQSTSFINDKNKQKDLNKTLNESLPLKKEGNSQNIDQNNTLNKVLSTFDRENKTKNDQIAQKVQIIDKSNIIFEQEKGKAVINLNEKFISNIRKSSQIYQWQAQALKPNGAQSQSVSPLRYFNQEQPQFKKVYLSQLQPKAGQFRERRMTKSNNIIFRKSQQFFNNHNAFINKDTNLKLKKEVSQNIVYQKQKDKNDVVYDALELEDQNFIKVLSKRSNEEIAKNSIFNRFQKQNRCSELTPIREISIRQEIDHIKGIRKEQSLKAIKDRYCELSEENRPTPIDKNIKNVNKNLSSQRSNKIKGQKRHHQYSRSCHFYKEQGESMNRLAKMSMIRGNKQRLKQYYNLIEMTHQRYCGPNCNHILSFLNDLKIERIGAKGQNITNQLLRLISENS